MPIKAQDQGGLAQFAKDEGIDLTVVGPDDALAAGIVDLFQSEGLRIFGPTQAAARLESSKVFAKEFMQRHGIPTARTGISPTAQKRRSFAGRCLSAGDQGRRARAGQGRDHRAVAWESALAIHEIMDARKFGEAGSRVVIEEFLEGEECSIHALVDGTGYLFFPGAQDHKRALDGDEGLNTGGMGTFSPPAKLLTAALEDACGARCSTRSLRD